MKKRRKRRQRKSNERASESEEVYVGSLMLDSCRLIFERSHFERSENEFFRSRFSDLSELNSCAKLQN